jgi:pyruvate kinase
VVQSLDPTIALCAKIETREAIKDLDQILKVTDLVMVARGDLGLQMDIEDVPIMQKRIIDACNLAGKPVITATQMLESMITNSRPTRAEATDVANAVLDGTDALMLSGETAAGEYPIECVKTMVRIAEAAESKFDRDLVHSEFHAKHNDISHTDAIAHAVAELAKQLKPKAIVTTSTSGQTPRLVSKFRPRCPIFCATWNLRTQRQMAVVWGVTAIQTEGPNDTEKNIHVAIDSLLRKKRLKLGDQVIITAGVPAGVAGNTNMVMTQVVK